MIEIKCESIEELKQLLSLMGNTPESHATENATKAPELPWVAVPASDQAHTPDPEPVPFSLAQPEKAVEAEVKQETPAPTRTLAEVRAVLAEVQKKKGKEVLRSLLDEFGAKAVSKVPEDKLDELYEKAVALNA